MHHKAQRNEARERIVDREVFRSGLAHDARPPGMRFSIAPTLDGYEVVDGNGRPTGFTGDDARQANGFAQSLNSAAKQGPRALAHAFGANRRV